jgi:hypothetical protein
MRKKAPEDGDVRSIFPFEHLLNQYQVEQRKVLGGLSRKTTIHDPSRTIQAGNGQVGGRLDLLEGGIYLTQNSQRPQRKNL